jgi:hypothetical protein
VCFAYRDRKLWYIFRRAASATFFKLHTFYEEILLKLLRQFNYTINNFKLFGLISPLCLIEVYTSTNSCLYKTITNLKFYFREVIN